MTRRLEPRDRVRELGDASVPFLYDTHALFFSDDAVSLENELHKAFADRRVNFVNQRKRILLHHARGSPARPSAEVRRPARVHGDARGCRLLPEPRQLARAFRWERSSDLVGPPLPHMVASLPTPFTAIRRE